MRPILVVSVTVYRTKLPLFDIFKGIPSGIIEQYLLIMFSDGLYRKDRFMAGRHENAGLM